MKFICLLILSGIPLLPLAQPISKTKHVFIITTDGFRWQEMFTGADSLLINNIKYTSDTALTNAMYWDASVELRRKKLMPFFWNVIAKKGQLYGNRLFNNKVNMKNAYKISYPGYNEILTGYADLRVSSNAPVNNRNINILEYLNRQPAYSGKVVAFSSWNIFPYIINEGRSGIPVNSGYEMLEEDSAGNNTLINQVQLGIADKKHTRYDMLTYLGAREYIRAQHPKILFLGLGETDESAHDSRYDLYLQQASMADKMIADLWYHIQTDPFYKDNTTFIITTDHGRGNNTKSWSTHNLFTKGSGETWLAMIGPDIIPSGEIKADQQTYANQLVSTIALLLGERFETSHPVGKPVFLLNPGKEKYTIGKGR
ncbi:MAG: phosphoglyceromutase [Ferruginibacter sp.]|nr:phosphoglyceromutase [Ferruginibacter sp.]